VGDVVRVARQYDITRRHHQRDVGVHHVACPSRALQLSGAFPVVGSERTYSNAREQSCEVRLAGAIAPDLGNDRCARPQWNPTLLEEPNANESKLS
jgi:hypothetical protein